MHKFQALKDDILYYSNAWEAFLSALFVLLFTLIGLYESGLIALPFYGWLLLLMLVLGFYRLYKGRRQHALHPEWTRAEKVKALKDRLFYDQAKKYFIGGGLMLVLFVIAIISNIYSPWYVTTRFPALPLCYGLYFLVLGILSLRYERQQHREFLNAHPEQK